MLYYSSYHHMAVCAVARYRLAVRICCWFLALLCNHWTKMSSPALKKIGSVVFVTLLVCWVQLENE